MKNLAQLFLAAVALSALSACTTVEDRPATTQTSHTESSTLRSPLGGASATETHTTRNY